MITAVKPAAVQKNTVKPAAIEIDVRVYYNDYGNHRNNTEETRFLLDAQNWDIMTFSWSFFCTSALIADVLFIRLWRFCITIFFYLSNHCKIHEKRYGTLFDLEGYKHQVSNKYKKWMVSSYMERPILYAHLIWNHLLQHFEIWDINTFWGV